MIDLTASRSRLEVTSVMAYSVITLLGVTAAATAKEYIESTVELVMIAFGTCLGLFFAHSWSAVLAELLVKRETLDWRLVKTVAGQSSAAFIPAVVLTGVLVVSDVVDGTFETAVTLAMLVLDAVLFLFAAVAAWRMGRTIAVSMLWGAGSALIGLAIVVLKIFVGV